MAKKTLVLKSVEGSELFSDVAEIYLESCVELKSVPKAGFLAHVALEEGESLGSISTTLPSVNRKYATSYHLEPEQTDEDGAFDAEPFIVLKKTPAKKTAATKKAAAPKKTATRKPRTAKPKPVGYSARPARCRLPPRKDDPMRFLPLFVLLTGCPSPTPDATTTPDAPPPTADCPSRRRSAATPRACARKCTPCRRRTTAWRRGQGRSPRRPCRSR